MIPVEFDYKKANSLQNAFELLAGGDAKILSGGHSLVPAMKLRLNQPAVLVDISKIASLKGISKKGGILVIGANTTHSEIGNSDLVSGNISLLSDGAKMIGDAQVRNRGTLGGSLAHADPSADWPALVLATDATIVCESADGERAFKATDFFTGLYSTALNDGEIITEVHFPIPPKGSKMTYQKFSQPASRFAIVGCAVVKHPDGSTKVAFSGVADYAFRDSGVENAANSGASADAASANAANGVDIMGDHFASSEYRHHLAKVYAKRALLAVA